MKAFVLSALRQFDKAEATFTTGVDRLHEMRAASDSSSDDWLLYLLQAQAYTYFMVGNLRNAIGTYARLLNSLLQWAETTSDPQKRDGHLLDAANRAYDLGVVYSRVRDDEAALHRFRQAETLLQKTSVNPPSEQQLRAELLVARADLIAAQYARSSSAIDTSDVGRALTLVRRSLELYPAPTSALTTRRYSLESELLAYLGHPSEGLARNAQGLASPAAANDEILQALLLLKQGYLHVLAGNGATADSVLQRALALSRSLERLDYQRRSLHFLGTAHEQMGHWTTAERYYRDAIRTLERYRQSLQATDWAVTAFDAWQTSYRGLARTLLAQERPADAFLALERTRARHLSDLNAQARLSQQLPPGERVRFDSLTQVIADLRNTLSTDLPSDSASFLRAQVSQLVAERQALVPLDSAPDTLSLPLLQGRLSDQRRVLVSYFLHHNTPVAPSKYPSYAFVLTPDSLHTVRLPNLTQHMVDATIADVSPLFTSRGKTSSLNATHFDLRPLHELYTRLYQPIRPFLPNTWPLVVLPDGPLFHIPFAALVKDLPDDPFRYEDATFVLEERPISFALAARMLLDPPSASPALNATGRHLAAFGVSSFSSMSASFASLQKPGLPLDPASRSTGRPRGSLPALPGVEDELEALRSLFEEAHVALNESATESKLHNMRSSTSVLHLASHAFVNESSPLYNAFLLHPDSSSRSKQDGVLFLHELRTTVRDLSLVVLSGCSTARGVLRAGEGMEGMQYAFRAMGAKATLSTLWPAEDKAAVALTRTFYRLLRNGEPKDRALRQAKLQYLKNHPNRHSPFYWSSSVLYGSPHALSTPALLPSWAWTAGIGVLLVIGFGLAARYLSPRWSLP